MSTTHDEEDICHKIMRLIRVDEDTGIKIAKILLLNPKQKKKNMQFPVENSKLQCWRDKHVGKQGEMRDKMRQLGVVDRNIERVLHYMYGAGGHIFPEDMHQAVDRFHRDEGWADYMQCDAKCTTCDVPCFTSANFGKSKALEQHLQKKRMELMDELHRRQEPNEHPLFYEKLMQVLQIDVSTAMRVMDTMRLKYAVTWDEMKDADFGKHWWAYSWNLQNERKYTCIRGLIGPEKTNIFENLLMENVHRSEGAMPRPPGVDFNEHAMVRGQKIQANKPHNHHGKKKAHPKHQQAQA